MNKTIGFFGFQAKLYDAYQSSCVPKYPEMVSVATRFLSRVLKHRLNVSALDAGCGTGNTAAQLAAILPEARISCVDGSQEMIREAKEKLRGRDVDFRCLDLSEPHWSAGWEDSAFDAIISVLVLEHLDFSAYKNCLGQFLRILKPGGWLVTVEGYAGETNQECYFQEMAAAEIDAVKRAEVTQEQLEEIKRRSKEEETHYFASMDEKKNWWLNRGFSDVDFIWQYFCVAILTGRKRL